MKSIYLDYAATSPLLPEVLEAMLPLYREQFGNPSSLHAFGRNTRQAVDQARDTIADLLHCEPAELFFTSGGTESDNLAIIGTAFNKHSPGHVITSSIEHPAVLEACRRLEELGWDVTYLPVDQFGQVQPSDVEKHITPQTVLISIMAGNNETGTLQPIEAIGQIARERGIVFHVDAVQALGTIPFRLSEMPIDLASFSAHKIGGPKGTGLLYMKRGTHLKPLFYGGSQEKNKRAGTENVAGIVGMAKAMDIYFQQMEQNKAKYEALRKKMIAMLRSSLDEDAWAVNGHELETLPHILNISFIGAHTETLLMNLDIEGIAVSGGSACSAGSLSPSHVLQAMGLSDDRLHSAIRFSFGPETTEEEIIETAKKVATIVNRISYIKKEGV